MDLQVFVLIMFLIINEHDGINKYAGLIYFFVYYVIKAFIILKNPSKDGGGNSKINKRGC